MKEWEVLTAAISTRGRGSKPPICAMLITRGARTTIAPTLDINNENSVDNMPTDKDMNPMILDLFAPAFFRMVCANQSIAPVLAIPRPIIITPVT